MTANFGKAGRIKHREAVGAVGGEIGAKILALHLVLPTRKLEKANLLRAGYQITQTPSEARRVKDAEPTTLY